jgi:hypothetical protein
MNRHLISSVHGRLLSMQGVYRNGSIVHSFLASALGMSGQLYALADLPWGKAPPSIRCVGSCVNSKANLDWLERQFFSGGTRTPITGKSTVDQSPHRLISLPFQCFQCHPVFKVIQLYVLLETEIIFYLCCFHFGTFLFFSARISVLHKSAGNAIMLQKI